ncbi:transposable element Tcb2 transposase [Trichonephila clavipes]|uniref:Transposable element Tcb2 transposase n=1 Tax=Trichonephila clavipes TaxID=2585209 RepID=A0A8X6SL18_TRICX|nr:transposable element Tcb2 transposase [Trichonephila clavipes]
MKTAGWWKRRVAGEVVRSEKTTRREDRRIVRKALVDPAVTRSTIRADVGVAIVPQAISRHLAEANLKSKRPFRIVPLTPEHRQLRLQWCQARSMWNVTDWQKVVFSDESWFVLGTEDYRVRVWRRPGERYNSPYIDLRHTARTAGAMQYNARPHTARVAQDFLRPFQTLPWPTRSPDLSPVEHVWDQLKRQMPSCHSVCDLELAVQDLWAHLPQDNIRCLINSMPDGVMHVLQLEIPAQLACAYLKGHLKGRALDWFEVLGYRVIEDKTTDYAHLKQALSEQFPVVRNRSELETRFYSSSQRRDQQPSDFIYELLKIHKILKLEMSEEKLIDHVVSRLEPQILDYVEVRHPRNTANLLQIVDKYEERFMHRQIRGSSEGFRSSGPHENNRFNTRHRQENWRENRNNERYANNSRPQREFNRFENQGFANRRFEGKRQGGQSDQPFHSQGGRQSGSRNSSFRGQNERSRNLNF